MKQTIITMIEHPIQIHMKNNKIKQIQVKDLITNEDFMITLNLKSPIGAYILGIEGILIINLSYKKGGEHIHPKHVKLKDQHEIKLKYPEFFI